MNTITTKSFISRFVEKFKSNEGVIAQKFAKDVVFITILWVIAQALNYFFNLYVANTLPTDHFAQYGSMLGFIYVFSVVGETLSSYITKATAKTAEKSHKVFRKSLIKLILPFLIIVSALLFGISPLLAKWLIVDISLVISLIAILFGFVAWGIMRGSFMGKQMIITAYLYIMLEAILKYAVGYLGINYLENTLPALLAYGVPGLLIAGIAMLVLRRKEAPIAEANIKVDLKDPLLIMLTLVLFNAIFTFDTSFLPFELRADYTAIAILGKIVFFAASMTIPLMFSRITKSQKVKEKRLYLLFSFSFALIAGSVLTLLYKVLGYDLITLLYNGKFYAIESLLPIYSIGATFYAFGLISLNYDISISKYGSSLILAAIFICQFFVLRLFADTLYLAVSIQTAILFTTGLALSIRSYLLLSSER